MEKIVINGTKPLKGEIYVTGAKNAALGILPAAILADSPSVIDNVPDISDIQHYITMLRKLGAGVRFENHRLTIDPRSIRPENIRNIDEEVKSMRASYYLYGALLTLFKKVTMPLPGGCNLGDRPIDQHVKAFNALGVDIDKEKISKEEINPIFDAHCEKLTGTEIYFDLTSVGATINALLASVKAEGTTMLYNAAKEPHVVDVANFLVAMGARITGAGTDTIKIRGVEKLNGCEYSVVADQICIGTYMIAAAATEGDITIKGIIPEHLDSVTAKLREMGNDITSGDDWIKVVGKRPLKGVTVLTKPYPGFPTDLQQPMGVLMCLAEEDSEIYETIFTDRFQYTEQLIKMGADIRVHRTKEMDGEQKEIDAARSATFKGVGKLKGAEILSNDLRAGAAMVIAGLAAEGQTIVSGIEHIERGYEDIVGNFRALGADIRKVDFN